MSAALVGSLVRLAALDAERDAPLLARWSEDAGYLRLMDALPARPRPAGWMAREWRGLLDSADDFYFLVRTLDADRPVGVAGLDGVQWAHGHAFMSVGLGERDCWGRGLGSDATRVLLRYAFEELNLQRVSLNFFGYNGRARHTYEKLGFRYEGAVREFLRRDGRRWDLVFMGLLRSEYRPAG